MLADRTIFVDGYNVIRNTPALAEVERGSLAVGRDALLARLTSRYRHTPYRVIVVFDGDGPTQTTQRFPSLSRGAVIFTCARESADAVIIQMAAVARGAGAEVSVISDDLEVRDGVSKHGAATAGVGDLQRRLDEGPRLLRKRFTHQAAVKRILAGDDREEQQERRGKGNPRRAPRKRDQQRWDPPI